MVEVEKRTVSQFIITIKSTIVPDNPVGDDYVNTELDKHKEEWRAHLEMRLPAGYFAELEMA